MGYSSGCVDTGEGDEIQVRVMGIKVRVMGYRSG